jgi:hypothetical protein
MLRIIRRISRISQFIVVSLSLFILTQASAQQAAEPILIQVNQLEIKPGKLDEFRAVHKNSFMPASRERGVPWRVTNRTALGNTLQVVVATPIPNMAALGNQNPPGATALETELAMGIWNETVISRRSFIITSRPDISMPAVPNTGMTTMVHFQLKPGKDVAFAIYLKESILPAMAASGVVGAQVFQTTVGGPAGEFWLQVPQTGYAAMDGPGPFSSVSVAEGARMQEMAAELFVGWDTSFNIIDQELSYGLPGLRQ